MSRTFSQSYWRGFKASIRGNSAAFGFSVVVTADFYLLSDYEGEPGLAEVYTFIAGTVVAFALLQAIATHFFEEKLNSEPSQVVAISSALDMLCVGAAVGTVYFFGLIGDGWWIWPATSFASTVIYLVTLAAQMAIAEQVRAKFAAKRARVPAQIGSTH